MVRRPKPTRSTRTRPTTGLKTRSRSTSTRRTTSPARSRPPTPGRRAAQAEVRRSDLDGLTKISLLELAKRLALHGRHRLSKADLIRALRDLLPAPTSPSGEAPTPLPPPPEESPPADVVSDGLPSRYGVTELVALPVDPVQVYLYWELTPDAVAAARRALGPAWEGASLVLRTYDVANLDFDGTNAHHQFDTEVWGDVGNWFFHLWRPEQTLLVEIGWRGRNGHFIAVARSNLVQTPRTAPCEHGEERWMTITDEGPAITPSEAIPIGNVPDQGVFSNHESSWSATLPTSGQASRRFR